MIKADLGVHCDSTIAEWKSRTAEREVGISVSHRFPSAEEVFALYTGAQTSCQQGEVSTIVAYHCDMVARLITTFLVVLAPLTVLTTLCKNHIWNPDVQ